MHKKITQILLLISIVFILLLSLHTTAIALSKHETYETEDITFTIKSLNGYDLKIRSLRPKFSKYPDKQFPAVLRIGGGWGNSTFLLNSQHAKKAASIGIIIVAFDSELKSKEKVGSSLRDYNGFKDQKDVATVLKSIVEHPNIDKNQIGIWSHSNGVTLAAGVLGREKYHKLSKKVLFLLDDEGPHSPQDLLKNPDLKFHTAGIREKWKHVINVKVGQNKEYKSEKDFFYERSAINFISNYDGIYQRIQAKNDHQTIYHHVHAAAMLNAATKGKARWTRLNKQPQNIIYKSSIDLDAINIEDALDVEKLTGPNDKRIWDIVVELFEQ